MEIPKFTVTYTDGSTFTGDSLIGDWNKVDKPIQKMLFTFGGVSVQLENYKSYNHLVERMVIIGGKATKISKFFIMGRLENTCDVYEFNLRTKRSLRSIVPIGKEYGVQLITGWKDGVTEGQVKFKHGKF